MFCIYLSLLFLCAGIGVWIAGSRIDKKKNQQSRAKRKKYQQRAEKLGTAARVLFVLCALSFVLGFIMLQGGQL